MKQKEIAQNRFIGVGGEYWYAAKLFGFTLRDICINSIKYLNDERFAGIEVILKLKEPTEQEILSQCQQGSEPF